MSLLIQVAHLQVALISEFKWTLSVTLIYWRKSEQMTPSQHVARRHAKSRVVVAVALVADGLLGTIPDPPLHASRALLYSPTSAPRYIHHDQCPSLARALCIAASCHRPSFAACRVLIYCRVSALFPSLCGQSWIGRLSECDALRIRGACAAT